MRASLNDRIENVNSLLVKFLPELSSKYAKWPMARPRWHDFSETDPEGKPIFVAGPKGPTRVDYVYCTRGPEGIGYYHLLNRVAYVNLFNRLNSEKPTPGCCNKIARTTYSEYKEVRAIVYNRSVASIPDDDQAEKDGHPVPMYQSTGIILEILEAQQKATVAPDTTT